MAVGPLGRASLDALMALRRSLPAASDATRGVDFSLTPPPRGASAPQPVREIPSVRDPKPESLEPRTIQFPFDTGNVDPSTGRPITAFREEVIRPINREQLAAVDEVFFADPVAGYMSLLSDIETISDPNQLYQAATLLRRYRPTIGDKLSKAAEKQLEQAAINIGVPVNTKMGAMNLFRYIKPVDPIQETRGYVSSKELLDEIVSIGRKNVRIQQGVGVARVKGDPMGAVVRLDMYDKGPDGGLIGRAVRDGDIVGLADERAVRTQLAYWRNKALEAVGLEDSAFRGISGLRYADDMPESEAYKRTIAAIRSASTDEEVAMILSQSRGRINSMSFVDLIEDAADTRTLELSGDALAEMVHPRYQWLQEILEEQTRPRSTKEVDVEALQETLKRLGSEPLDERLLRPLDVSVNADPRGIGIGANITPSSPTPSVADELGGLSSGTGYGREFRGGTPELEVTRPVRLGARSPLENFEFQNAVFTDLTMPALSPRGTAFATDPSVLSSGTELQQRWAAKYAEGRMAQLTSDQPELVREAVGAMQEAVANGWVSPQLLERMREISAPVVSRSGITSRRKALEAQRKNLQQSIARGDSKFHDALRSVLDEVETQLANLKR